MTVAIALSTTEGTVLGADSTTTVSVTTPTGAQWAQLYNSAQKIFEIGPSNREFIAGRSFSAALTMCGDGSFGPLSWRNVINEFWLQEISEKIDGTRNIATIFLSFLQEKWVDLKRQALIPQALAIPDCGMAISVIPPGGREVETFEINVRAADIAPFAKWELRVFGDPTTFYRIVKGYDVRFLHELQRLGIDPVAFNAFTQPLSIESLLPQMPLRDAIDFVHFMLYSSIKLHRYKGGPATVGGPIEIATITADRGFRWVSHKPLHEAIGIPRGEYSP